jgi:hypothetical protein
MSSSRHTCGVLLIERYWLSQRNRCFGTANLLEEIVDGLALRVDDGRPSVFEWLEGPLLVRDGCKGLRTGAAEDEARSKGETKSYLAEGTLAPGIVPPAQVLG